MIGDKFCGSALVSSNTFRFPLYIYGHGHYSSPPRTRKIFGRGSYPGWEGFSFPYYGNLWHKLLLISCSRLLIVKWKAANFCVFTQPTPQCHNWQQSLQQTNRQKIQQTSATNNYKQLRNKCHKHKTQWINGCNKQTKMEQRNKEEISSKETNTTELMEFEDAFGFDQYFWLKPVTKHRL